MEKRKKKSSPLFLVFAILFLFILYQIISCFPVQARAPIVVINPGHSVGTDPGATNTTTHVKEADLNAAIAAKTAERLKQQGYDVYLTQPVSGCSIPSLLSNISESNSLGKVANAVNSKNPDLALAVHHNSDGNKSGGNASGYELYWSSYRDFDKVGVSEVPDLWGGGVMAFRDSSPCLAAQQSKVFAEIVKSAFDGFDIKYNRTVERDDYLPAHTKCPSILFEGGYVSNDSESRILASDGHQNATADRLVNAVNVYFGRYGDTEQPTAESITTPEASTTNAVFTVTANNVVDKITGVKNVRFAVWTGKNSQDDIQWNDGKNDSNGNWSYQIDINDHGGQLGTYIVHVYAMDFAGNDGFIGDVVVDVVAGNNVPAGVSYIKLSNDSYKIYAKNFSGYSDYQFPAWSNNNAQDDIIWHQGVRQTDGSYAAIVNIREHGSVTGDYTVHVYAKNSKQTELLGAVGFNVPQMTAESIKTSEAKDGKYTVTISGINAPAGIKQIQVPTWSANGGQNDIVWYSAKQKDGKTYTLEVDIKNHEYDTGKYISHVYGIDNNGKQIFLGATNTNVPQMTVESVTASTVKDGKFTVTINGVNTPAGIRQMQVPIWSSNGGQDDIIWYGATRKNSTTYELTVDIKNHGYDTGDYKAHVYGTDNNGKMLFLGSTITSVPQMTAGNVTASAVKDGKFTVMINDINAPAGIKQIQVPVWSSNGGQDDIIWYGATRKNSTTYELTVDIKNHGYDTGDYKAHVYGTDNNGKMLFLGSTITSVPQMTAGSVTASAVKDGKFTVMINDINAPAGIKQIQVPVWSSNGGQDDVVWYSATRKDSTIYELTVDIKNHGYDTGDYKAHVYGTDNNGKMLFLGSSITNAPKMTEDNITVSEAKDGKFTVIVSGIQAPNGVRLIQVPVWSDVNGQDDIRWYEAAQQSDGSYQYTVMIQNHGNDTGRYNVHCYGTDNNGIRQGLGATSVQVAADAIINAGITIDTPIMGAPSTSAQTLAAYFNSKANFPTSFYGMSATDFAQMYIDESKAEGIRPEVAFAQMCLETGYLQYGGDVKREQYNFAGIGATGGVPGNSFSDVRIGIRAQIQHLKAYASTDDLKNECVDPRYKYVTKGCAKTIEGLAGPGKWATDKNYANKLVTIISAF